MQINTENIKDSIHADRPLLKPNTIKQYEINLNKLKKMFDAEGNTNMNNSYDFLENPTLVMDKISHLHYTSQRNYLNAIIVLLCALNHEKKYDKILEKYGKIRDDFNDKYANEQKSGIISDKQSKNFTTIEEVYKMIDTMADELKPIKFKTKDQMTLREKSLLQVYTLFNIYSRMPMRNDVAGMEAIQKRRYNQLSEEDKKENNYLVIDRSNFFFVLNKYKTSKKYEELKLPIEDKKLKRILRYYLKINGLGILFTSSTGKALSRNALTQLLIKTSQKYMKKSISTTLLRKIYLSSKYGKMKDELEKDNKVMMHSKEVALNTYVKKHCEPEPEN